MPPSIVPRFADRRQDGRPGRRIADCQAETQIYLTERQRVALAALAEAGGKKQSELIREAIDRLIDQSSRPRREAVLQEVAGIWKNRTDLPDFDAMRAEWQRAAS